MTKRAHDDEELSATLDELMDGAEHLLRSSDMATTNRLLTHLETILWEVARMDASLREARPGVVTDEDRKVFRKAFGRIQRESERLVSWLRFDPLEQSRN